MNLVENFRLSAQPFQTQNIEITPSYKHNIIGLFLHFGGAGFNPAQDLFISLTTANSETIINNISANVLGYKYLEWDKSFIPTNIPSQRLFLRVESPVPFPVNFDFVLVYNTENTPDR